MTEPQDPAPSAPPPSPAPEASTPAPTPAPAPDGVRAFRSEFQEKARSRRRRLTEIALDDRTGKPVDPEELMSLGADPSMLDKLLGNAERRARRNDLLATMQDRARTRTQLMDELARVRSDHRDVLERLNELEAHRLAGEAGDNQLADDLKHLGAPDEEAQAFINDGTLPT